MQKYCRTTKRSQPASQSDTNKIGTRYKADKVGANRRRALAKYLLKLAQVWQAMDLELDERLVRHGLRSRDINAKAMEPLLHIRRTLDQSYFLNLKDTSQRDKDQVVYRATKGRGNLARVVMVDQLWLWILDERTFVSVFYTLGIAGQQELTTKPQTRLLRPSRRGGDVISPTLLEYTKAFEIGWVDTIAKSCQPGT